jgi:hypothetical protein
VQSGCIGSLCRSWCAVLVDRFLPIAIGRPFLCRSFSWARLHAHSCTSHLALFFPRFLKPPPTQQRAKQRLQRPRTRRSPIAARGTDRTFLCSGCSSRAFPIRPFHTVYPYFSFSSAALKHRERQRGCAQRLGGLLLRSRACTGFGSSRFAGTLQESRPWHLGAASRSRPPGGVP